MKTLPFGTCVLLAALGCGTDHDAPSSTDSAPNHDASATVDTGSNDAAPPPADSRSSTDSRDSPTDAISADSGIMCSYAGASYSPGTRFPASDSCNTCTCTSEGDAICTRCACIRTEASTELPMRCGQGDAASDGCTTCVDQPVVWYEDGGRRSEYPFSSISPCHTYRYATTSGPPKTGTVIQSCTQEFSCNGFLSAFEIQDELSQPDVVAALAAAPVLYGTDSRLSDGTVFHLEVGGKVIEVGGGDQIPSGIVGIRLILRAFEKSQLATGECARVFVDAGP